MHSNEIRRIFLEYFRKKNHQIVLSSSLIPANDPTLLFTNAGMVQFKDVFLGQEQRTYSRAASAQRCVRAGGKHNDLDNVGYTARHHTFFEMLGNFSFGDYFKKEAIQYAWRFLTEVLHIPREKLWVTVYKEDKEAEQIWLQEIKVDPKRFSRCGEADNFWAMGDTGPCGPCTEIFYDHGAEILGGPPGSVNQDGDRYVEIWNLVFMQFNRSADGRLTPLPKPSVDTGMGLERIAAVMQGVHSNYEIDIFRHLIQAAAKVLSTSALADSSLKVIADHIRSTAFLIADGVRPANEGRGYVLRRIMRRAIRHGHKLGQQQPFFHLLVEPLVQVMGEAYPELIAHKATIEKAIAQEEKQFARTLQAGMEILEHSIARLIGDEIPGELIFQLYDTYGFPPDLTGDIARERHLKLDYPGFERYMSSQRERSQAHQQFTMQTAADLNIEGETEFVGYESLTTDSKVIAILVNSQHVQSLAKGQSGQIVLDRTTFYAESGGQVGDKGYLYFEGGRFRVDDTKKQGTVYLHQGQMEEGALTVGQSVNAEVSSERIDIMLNHSATHLLHSALRRVLGTHVLQKGSLVEAERLRFDFTHTQPMTKEEIEKVEKLVNQQIRANLPCTIQFMNQEKAKASGALALFDEKYGDEVRVLSMGEFSRELCGGTHVANTGEIGYCKITVETGVAAGIRRIEAVTGERAINWVNQLENQITTVGNLLRAGSNEVIDKLQQLLQDHRQKDKLLLQLQQKLAVNFRQDLIKHAKEINGVKVVTGQLPGVDVNTLRETVDWLKQELKTAAIILATVQEDKKIQLIAGATSNIQAKLPAGEMIKWVAEQVGGKGGGRPDMAQGGGNDVAALPAALLSVTEWVKQRL